MEDKKERNKGNRHSLLWQEFNKRKKDKDWREEE